MQLSASDPVECFMVEVHAGSWRRLDGRVLDAPTNFRTFLPIGAMWWRRHPLLHEYERPRPLPHLAVMTAGGLFCIDCPALDTHRHWERGGEPPSITLAEPVVLFGWTGWLKEGLLI